MYTVNNLDNYDKGKLIDVAGKASYKFSNNLTILPSFL